jgi:hypothetical protein
LALNGVLMDARPSPDQVADKLQELCHHLSEELEVVSNLIYLAGEPRLRHEKCEHYLEVAQSTVDRLRKLLLKHC